MHIRRISLVRRPTRRQIRSVLGNLPRPLSRPQDRVFGRWFVDEVGHPGVPAGFYLTPFDTTPNQPD